jgi:hypothetical protein
LPCLSSAAQVVAMRSQNFRELRICEVQDFSLAPAQTAQDRRRGGHLTMNSVSYVQIGRLVVSTYIRNTIAQDRGAGNTKAGLPWRGGYRQARRNNKILTLCNASNNLRICRKWMFSSQRGCALIPTWRGMGDPLVESPIECQGQHGQALRHRTGDM